MAYSFDPRFLALPSYRETVPLTLSQAQQQKLESFLASLWPEQEQSALTADLLELLQATRNRLETKNLSEHTNAAAQWSEQEIVLICYGDHIRSRDPRITPLQALEKFCQSQFHEAVFSHLTVHLLPIYESPYKDGGFDISDPFAVNPRMGTWDDVRSIGRQFQLAVDFVANHFSIASDWFQRYMRDDPLYKDFFIGFDDEADVRRMEREVLPKIYRPRPHNPFIPVKKPDGSTRWVYMTFSDHQADVNYANPFVFLKMTEILLFYILQGAGMVRLDAIPYLWKEWGTACAHHPKTHAIVELTRLIVDIVKPGVKLLAESMEPLADSMRYLSTDDTPKAHLAYNFVPCGLIPHTILSGDAGVFQQNLTHFQPPHSGVNWAVVCGVTHDGSSVNPCRAPKSVEGDAVLNEAQIKAIGDYYTEHGYRELQSRCALNPDHAQHVRPDYADVFTQRHREAPRFVNYKTISDAQGQAQRIVYEAISTYASLFDGEAEKIVAAISLALALPGIPFLYLTLPFAVPNDFEYYLETGNPRELNRGRVYLEDILHKLKDAQTLTSVVFHSVKRFLRVRASHPAFNPDGAVIPIPTDKRALLSFLRESVEQTQRILVVQNVSANEQTIKIDLSAHVAAEATTCTDLISNQTLTLQSGELELTLARYAIRWIEL